MLSATRSARCLEIVALALAALAPFTALTQPEPAGRKLLNSERIERGFGSYDIEVLAQDAHLRVSNLYSGAGDERVTRTFAVVRYAEQVDPRIADAHATIVTGGSIGAVFTERGWRVRKRHRFFGTLDSGARVERMMGGIESQPLATHVYTLDVVKDGVEIEYATIAEVHHPDYLTPDDLRSIYGGVYEPPVSREDLASLLEILDIAKQRIGEAP